MHPLFRLFGIEKNLAQFVSEIPKQGWFVANKNYIAHLGIGLHASLRNFPQKGGVLVYANHVTGLDPFLVSSVLGRDDVYVVSDSYHLQKGNAVAKHLLPVYYSSWKHMQGRSLIATIGYLTMRLLVGFSSRQDAGEKNRDAITNAISHLVRGHVVIIFPSGGSKEDVPWRKGIGEIIMRCQKEKKTVRVYQCMIQNLDEVRLLWHFLFFRKYYRMHSVFLRGDVVTRKELSGYADASTLTAYLQSRLHRVQTK